MRAMSTDPTDLEGGNLTEPPGTGGRRGNLDVGEDALGHRRGVDHTLKLLVEAQRIGVHVLVGVRGDLDLIVDCAHSISHTLSRGRTEHGD